MTLHTTLFRTCALVLSIAAMSLPAQDRSSTGSIGGSVLDDGTGKPMAQVAVIVPAGAKSLETKTNSNGHYEFRDVAPGLCRMVAYSLVGASGSRTITLGPGQHLASIDFRLEAFASAAGKVVDDNKEPLPGMVVELIAREYQNGSLRYVLAGPMAQTDDRGQYTLTGVAPGRGYLILARKPGPSLSAISDVPADAALRKPVLIPTWFGDSDSTDGAEIVTLGPGERREAIDIRVRRSPSQCVEGVLDAEGVPAPLGFFFEPERPTSGRFEDGAALLMQPRGQAGADGRIRLCNLTAGTYRLTAFGENLPSLGETIVAVGKEDVRKLSLTAHRPAPVVGEVAIEGVQPAQPLPSKLGLALSPVVPRLGVRGEEGLVAQSSIPGAFSFGGVLPDEYAVEIRNVPPDFYIKDVTYGGASVLHLPLRADAATASAHLHIVLASDGGTIATKVADRDGNPVQDCNIVVVPTETGSDAALADAIATGRTDQYGAYSSPRLAPGKYYVLATAARTGRSPEFIGKLTRALNRLQDVELGAGASVQVSLSPTGLD